MKPTSALQTIHTDSVSTLYFDPDVPCSHIVWHGFASSQDFRTACMRAYELIRERGLSKSISDARNLRIISIADQQWFLEEYLPLILELRLSTDYYSATLMPKDYFGRQSVDAITEQALDIVQQQYDGIHLTTRFFDNEADARLWLSSVSAAAEPTTETSASASEENAQAA